MNDLIFSICDLVRDPIRDSVHDSYFSTCVVTAFSTWKSLCNTEQLAQLYVLISD